MRIDRFSFGTIRIDGETYDRDVVIDRGEVRPRKKKASKPFRGEFGHTPLSVVEKIPWKCTRLVIGTGAAGALPVMPAVYEEAERRGVELTVLRTAKAIELLRRAGRDTNAVLHITC
ncbi:MAG TPA: MTH938/NDUFAF3 family protein [Candidatus Dormibacteraeota bacterium]|nr:MTH938/NDUFAF3 family protein [Candidatus Dormibacteraeota bacterium]